MNDSEEARTHTQNKQVTTCESTERRLIYVCNSPARIVFRERQTGTLKRTVGQQTGFRMLIFKYTHFIPEYEFNETPHLTTTPSNTQIDTRLQVCIISTAKFSLRKNKSQNSSNFDSIRTFPVCVIIEISMRDLIGQATLTSEEGTRMRSKTPKENRKLLNFFAYLQIEVFQDYNCINNNSAGKYVFYSVTIRF